MKKVTGLVVSIVLITLSACGAEKLKHLLEKNLM